MLQLSGSQACFQWIQMDTIASILSKWRHLPGYNPGQNYIKLFSLMRINDSVRMVSFISKKFSPLKLFLIGPSFFLLWLIIRLDLLTNIIRGMCIWQILSRHLVRHQPPPGAPPRVLPGFPPNWDQSYRLQIFRFNSTIQYFCTGNLYIGKVLLG